jgi:crotonobetainyl-CoA:carnitine CoA-transferase CaiB-like acyl-CoA transferase
MTEEVLAEPLPLYRHLQPILGQVPEPRDWRSGPRWWWGGALDVEGLALGAMGALIAALDALAPSPEGGKRASTSSELLAASFDSVRHLTVDGKAPDIWAPMSGFRPTADGWVRLHANYPHHAERLLAGLGIADASQLDAALRERSALDVEADVRQAGGVAAAVRSGEDWSSSPMGQAAAFQPWMDVALAEDTAKAPLEDSGTRPLAGVRVLDLTRVIAGPSATRLLGALGADVLRIDPPRYPELLDAHLDADFAKRSAVVDLADGDQLARVRELAAAADVVVLGYRAAALARFGLDPAALRADHPQLAVVSLNAWGRGGPWADARGFDSIVQAACGIAEIYGSEHDGVWRPGALPVQALDYATGLGIAAAAVALLAARRRGVTGSVHLSLAATAHELLTAPPPVGTEARTLPVAHRQAQSPHGVLGYVPPPLLLGGAQLEYPQAPERYGSASLEWL